MSDLWAAFLHWLGFAPPLQARQRARIDLAVQQRKAACIRLDNAVRDIKLSPRKK